MKKFVIIGLVLLSQVAFAQRRAAAPVVKEALTEAAYDEWKSITFRQLTPNGQHLVYTLNPEDSDGKVVFQNLAKNTEKSVDRAASIALTVDSKHAIFLIKAQKDSLTHYRRIKKKREEMPKDTLGIFDFQTQQVTKIADVKSYKTPSKAGGWMAYISEKMPESTDEDSKPKKVSDDNGYTLVLKNLASGEDQLIPYVRDYQFDAQGTSLIYYSTGTTSKQAGVYVHDLSTQTASLLMEGHSKYKISYLSFDEEGEQVTFIADTDTTKALIRSPQLMYWKKGQATATALADASTAGVPNGWLISPNYNPSFSKDGKRLFLGTNPPPIVQDTTLLPEEIVNVEVWHWQDDYIYTEQNVRLPRERRRSFVAVMDLPSGKLTQLATEEISEIRLDEEGKAGFALGIDDSAYRMLRTWDISSFNDLYLVDMKNGTTKPIAKAIKGNARFSPDAGFVYWYSSPDSAWYTYHITSGKTTNLTKGLPVTFSDELNDSPEYPSSYNLAGWTLNEESILIYDRYDIWKFDPLGNKAPERLTNNGRENQWVYRYEKLDDEERFIDLSKALTLSLFDEKNKDAGFAILRPGTATPQQLLKTGHRYNLIAKAKEADVLLYTKENFQEFPDLHVAEANFAKARKVTTANPQQSKYRWGTAELVKWLSLDNIELEGILYKPENFDPNKKYPMVVFYYERFSNTLHNHHKPEPIRSAVHRTMYVSNDYLVFVPDVAYKIGFPGESALNAILPGVTSLIQQGFVDPKKVGLQGHSWSGYQTAYILTKSNMFAAAEAGAIVANMTSAYGGIRWETGLARAFQYEKTQSRLGVSIWENPTRYIENSPLFYADKIETPLLLMHNDADGHVPWYQGIEMYVAMRRLNKPTWMLNYNGEPHWPVKRQNRIDFQKRMMQFFDHYLKEAPMPSWMVRGVPATEKGILQGYELMDGSDN